MFKFIKNSCFQKRGQTSLLLFFFLVFSQQVSAKNFDVRVGFSHFPPWQTSKGKNWTGGLDKLILDKLVTELEKKHDIHLTIIPKKCPLKRCLRELQMGALDLKTGLLKQGNREEYLAFIEPPYQSHTNKVIYYDPARMNDIKHISDLYGYRIGIARGATTFPEFNQDKNIQKIPTNGTANGLRLVCANRLDAFVGTELVMDYILSEKENCTHLRKTSLVYKSQTAGYFAISKLSPLVEILPQLNSTMDQLVENGDIDRLVETFKRK